VDAPLSPRRETRRADWNVTQTPSQTTKAATERGNHSRLLDDSFDTTAPQKVSD
jgi:hypothetical protein